MNMLAWCNYILSFLCCIQIQPALSTNITTVIAIVIGVGSTLAIGIVITQHLQSLKCNKTLYARICITKLYAGLIVSCMHVA